MKENNDYFRVVAIVEEQGLFTKYVADLLNSDTKERVRLYFIRREDVPSLGDTYCFVKVVRS